MWERKVDKIPSEKQTVKVKVNKYIPSGSPLFDRAKGVLLLRKDCECSYCEEGKKLSEKYGVPIEWTD